MIWYKIARKWIVWQKLLIRAPTYSIKLSHDCSFTLCHVHCILVLDNIYQSDLIIYCHIPWIKMLVRYCRMYQEFNVNSIQRTSLFRLLCVRIEHIRYDWCDLIWWKLIKCHRQKLLWQLPIYHHPHSEWTVARKIWHQREPSHWILWNVNIMLEWQSVAWYDVTMALPPYLHVYYTL